MRPNPPEAIRGVVATLAGGILPELSTPWTQAQLRYSMSLLESIAAEWDAAAENLVRENEDLQRVCRVISERADAHDGGPLIGHMASLRQAAALPPPPGLRLSMLSEFNKTLWTALEPVIDAVGATDDTAGWAASVKSELRPVLRAYVATRQFRAQG